MNSRNYAGHWEKPEWLYDQAQKVDARIKSPEIIALRTRSMPLFQQQMAKEFPEFFQHYTKIFFRAIHGKLNGPLFLMLLKQRQKMDNGEVTWDEGNHEVIGASFNLLLRKLPQEMQDKVMNTYKDLVDEEKADVRKAVQELLKKENADPTTLATTTTSQVDEETLKKVEQVVDSARRPPPQRIEVVDCAQQNDK